MKLLVISNNLVSENNGNGKVLKNYLWSFKDYELCNFYISNDVPSIFDKISNLNITNQNALLSLFLSRNHILSKNKSKQLSKGNNNKSPFKQLIRYMIWNLGSWKKLGFKEFIKSEKPTHVFLALGNNPYLLKLARKISKKNNLRLVIFACEDYPLKKHNFYNKKHSIAFWFLQRKLQKETKLAFKNSSLVIFNSENLKNAYFSQYSCKNTFVMEQLSSINAYANVNNKKRVLNLLYAGNLNLGRDIALKEFASTLLQVDSKIKIQVYTNLNESIRNNLKEPNIILHDYIPNKELVEKISVCDGLIHVEHNTPYNIIDLKYAFSTKLADMICSNKRMILYAPKELFETQYLLNKLPQCVITDKNMLEDFIKTFLLKEYDYMSQSKLAEKHSVINSSKLIYNAIEKC